MKVGQGEKYKEAQTFLRVVKRFRNFTFLEARITTGRTHQIRVHLRAIDHPVAGDNLYFIKRYKKYLPSSLTRLFLHSYYLSFFDHQGKKREFKIDLPQDLKAVLDQLKKQEI